MTKPYVLGIDIGGTNTVFGIVDARGQVVATGSIKTLKHTNFDEYVKELHDEVTRLLKANDAEDKIQGIGIGAPNANYYTGEILDPPNLPWGSRIPLAQKVSEAFNGIPVAITNDANAAALGEMTYGAARGMKDFIMITLGTGVGSGIVVNGQLVYGHDGFAGELGHIIMKRNNGRVCGCGRTGCLEAYCSATGVARSAREFLEARSDDSLLRNLDIDEITSKDVYDAAIQGDKLAIDIFNYTGEIMGEAFADMIAFSSPQAIILFGGLTKSGELLMKPIRDSLDAHVFPIFKGKTKVILSELKEGDAAVLGASALGWEAKYRAEQPSTAPTAQLPATEDKISEQHN
ncbi:MAG: ROK family protein [Prevotella sp.]|nr:ROK family protein [Bacteroides sp.]MCM1365865.1 ROK family protein [Prevotella sp.]